jgi:hypothetical protein
MLQLKYEWLICYIEGKGTSRYSIFFSCFSKEFLGKIY